MKRIAIVLAALVMTASAGAQQPQQNAAQAEIQKEATLLQAQTQLLYNKLRDIQEFQDYLADMNKLQQLQQRYVAAAKTETKPEYPKSVTLPKRK